MSLAMLRTRCLWILDHSWVLAFLLPFAYLLGNPAYFNKDDNFSQFTPIFKYAFEAILRGEIPWMQPGELNIRLAESPYYAIFSPVLFVAFLIAHALTLEPYWIVNIWSLIYFMLINLVLLKFANRFSIPTHMKGALLICAGIGSYMGQFSVNWYYVLPPLFLLVVKIYYWQSYITDCQDEKWGDALLLVATYLTIYGGNPQLFLYVQIVEFIFLAPLFTRKIFTLYLRNQLISLLLLAPYIYCQLEYWGHSWRTIFNQNRTKLAQFLPSGIFNVRQLEGQSIWILCCLVCVFTLLQQIRKGRTIDKLCLSLSIASILILLLSALNMGALLGIDNPLQKIFTTPQKWWFFGGITSVFAICLWSKCWTAKWQTYFAVFALLTSASYLINTSGKAAHQWRDLDYRYVNSSINILKQYSDGNSRIYQLSNFRNTEPHPSSHLLLNTWLTGNGNSLVFAKGYETVQAKENSHRELTQYFDQQNLSLDQYQNLGISTLWVNGKEYPKSLFDSPDYQIVHEYQDHFAVKLTKPGKIVSCENSDCVASIKFYADRILIDVDKFSKADLIRVKITPYSNFSISGDGLPIPYFTCDDQWLCFKPVQGINSYHVQYEDYPFLVLLIASNALFLALLAFNYLWPRRMDFCKRSNS